MRSTLVLAAMLLGSCGSSDGTTEREDGGAGKGGRDAGGSGGSRADAGPDGHVPDACSLPARSGNCDAYIPRYYHDAATGSCERFIYGGCGGNDNNFDSLAACEAACDVTPRSTPCDVEASDPSLPGVRVRIEADRCRLAIEQTHTFRFVVEVDQPITYTAPESSGCGHCGGYGSDPLALVDYAIEGGGHRYCECDVGCCAPTTSVERTLLTGRFVRELQWPGREWNGPSDTGEPLGPAFPPGAYRLRVTLEVPGEGSVTASLPLALYDPTGPTPSGASCEVGGKVYASGEDGIDDPTSCNTCLCNDGELVCTDIACAEPCPDGTAYGTSCSQCGPTDACEVVRHDCLPACDASEDCTDAGLWFCNAGVCKNVCG